MLRFLSDENFNGDIVRGLFLRKPDLDLVRVQETGLRKADDPTILAWAAEQDRILLTHDRATMPNFTFYLCSTLKGRSYGRSICDLFHRRSLTNGRNPELRVGMTCRSLFAFFVLRGLLLTNQAVDLLE